MNFKKRNIKQLKDKLLKNNYTKREEEKAIRTKMKNDKKAKRNIIKQCKIKRKDINKKGIVSVKKRTRRALILSFLVLSALSIRVAWIQFVNGEKLKNMVYLQQTLERKISSKRGTIYDSSGKIVLATSSSVETVTVNPLNIPKYNKEIVAKKLTQIFDLDYDMVLKKINKKTAIETIVKKVDKDKTNQLRMWMNENNIENGINIDEDTKRYYPYNSLASQIIGFCGSDNQGLAGIEAMYDSILKGSSGKILKMTDATGINIKNTAEYYEGGTDGKDLVLSIDATVQGIAEKYLEEACIDNKCTDGGNILIMNVNTGDVLAIASYPSYNLNEPYTINTDELKEKWNDLPQTDKSNALQAMWRNKAISDTYEPGSTFKLVTASTALEEGVVETTDKEGEFCCIGYIEVAGIKMKCWRYYRPHGSESLRQALMNSCNPVFIGLGEKIGVTKYYEYLRKYGFLTITGIDLPGEATGIFLAEKKVGPVELRNYCFWPKI